MKKTFESINAQAARADAQDYANNNNLVIISATTKAKDPKISWSFWTCEVEFGTMENSLQESIMTNTSNINAI
tara:strand:- start:353 stop:571 length:219 start_codon:yes stop_codon:yes gene_type:complete